MKIRHHQHQSLGTLTIMGRYNVKGKEKVDESNNHQKKFSKFKNRKHNGMNKTSRAKGQRKGKDKAFKYHECGGSNHFAKKYQTPQHLVELYQRSLMESNNAKRSYEAHFNNETKEVTTSGTIPLDPEMPMMMDNDDKDMKNTIVEYTSNDVFGGLK
jgi:hypothetical protein